MKITDYNINPESIGELAIFARNITYLRNKNNLSKKEMARLLGIGASSLNKLENGEIPERMSASVILKTSKAFNMRPCELFRDIKRDNFD